MKYMSKDGKTFDTERECRAYEERLKVDISEKRKAWEDVMKKKDEFIKAGDAFKKAQDEYMKKYHPEADDAIEDFVNWLLNR